MLVSLLEELAEANHHERVSLPEEDIAKPMHDPRSRTCCWNCYTTIDADPIGHSQRDEWKDILGYGNDDKGLVRSDHAATKDAEADNLEDTDKAESIWSRSSLGSRISDAFDLDLPGVLPESSFKMQETEDLASMADHQEMLRSFMETTSHISDLSGTTIGMTTQSLSVHEQVSLVCEHFQLCAPSTLSIVDPRRDTVIQQQAQDWRDQCLAPGDAQTDPKTDNGDCSQDADLTRDILILLGVIPRADGVNMI